MNKEQLVLSKEEMMNLQQDMNALQDKFGIDLVAVLDTGSSGIIPRIAIMKRPALSEDVVMPVEELPDESNVVESEDKQAE